jgi:hypothetical protein
MPAHAAFKNAKNAKAGCCKSIGPTDSARYEFSTCLNNAIIFSRALVYARFTRPYTGMRINIFIIYAQKKEREREKRERKDT